MPLTDAHIWPWRFGPQGSTPWIITSKILMPLWIILLLSLLTGCAQGENPRWRQQTQATDPRWRRSAGLSHMHRFVNSNGLDQELHSTHVHNYQLLLDELSGDFGIKSEVVAAAFREPEYRGADTVVVPLYIPRGAIPIRLARIVRSGSPDVLPLVDLKVSETDDSLLLRRVGLPHQGQGRRLPPPRLIHPTWHSQSELNDKTRQLNSQTKPNVRTAPPPSTTPSFSIRNYGRRVNKSDKEGSQEEDASNKTEEIIQETTKRTQHNELSNNSQLTGEISTTKSSVIQRSTTKRPSSISTLTSKEIKRTRTSVPRSKSLITSIESVPDDKDRLSESPKGPVEKTTSNLNKNLSTFEDISSTKKPPVDTSSSSHTNITFSNPSINSSVSHLSFANVTSRKATIFSPLKRTNKFIPVLITTSTEAPEKKSTDAPSVSNERPEHHSVLFPRPVESILKSSHSKLNTSTPSTTTLTTTEVYTNTTADTSKMSLRNKIRIRPWLSRTRNSTSTLSTTSTTPITPISTTTNTIGTTSASTTHIPPTTNSPPRKVTISSLSATTKKLQLITQKPPVFPTTFSNTNSTLNSTLQHSSRIKERQNSEKIIPESSANNRKETKEHSLVNIDSKFPQTSTTEKTLETRIENKLKTSNKTNIRTIEIQPIELIALDEIETEDKKEVIKLSNSTGEAEKTFSTPPTVLSTVNQEHSIKSNTKRAWKPITINGRPGRRIRLFRHITTSPAPSSSSNAKDLFSMLSTKPTLLPTTDFSHKNIATNSEVTTIMSKTIEESTLKEDKVSRTPSKGLNFKSHEQVVLDSLSEIMRDATNHSKDRVSNIAADLEALNRRLAERNIFIINAEVDGVRIKLNKTFGRGTYSFPTTSEPHSSFNPIIPTRKSTIITRQPGTPSAGILRHDGKFILENKESDKQVQTSVRSSFSMHTSKTTDIVSSRESLSDDTIGNIAKDTLLKSANTTQRHSIKPFIAPHSPESESPDESYAFISATATVPASVTTRTRSTTVPINTHRPTLKPLMVTRKDRYKIHETDSNEDQLLDLEDPSVIHPTSHLRPTQTNSPPASIAPATGTSSTSSSSLDQESRFFSITDQIDQTDPLDPQVSDAIPETKVTTTIYIVAVIGIIPAAIAVAFFFRRYLNKDEKSLPDAEEQAEGFTPPVTHHSRKPSQQAEGFTPPGTRHSRKPSQSKTMAVTQDSPVSRASSEKLSPSYTKTPWEFPRSKLRLVSILGEGNFGVVWKAEARDLCGCGENGTGGPTVLVAVKSVKDGAGLKERQDLVKELDIMQHLGSHPNVVTLLGCCTKTEPHLVIMEYVMFGKLLTFLRDVRTRHKYYNFSEDNEALTSKDLTRFASDVASGCEYLQSRGIIHRDLAARNILVDHNKVCKIADFGLARSVKDLGTDIYEAKSRGALPIRWMAPESLYMSIFTHKSDVWSFGILCWEIVTLGSTPYPGMMAREVMRNVQENYRLDRPEHCRPELYHIVTKCWHQDFNKRPSFSDIKLELAQLLDHQMGYVDLENFPEAIYYNMQANNEEKL